MLSSNGHLVMESQLLLFVHVYDLTCYFGALFILTSGIILALPSQSLFFPIKYKGDNREKDMDSSIWSIYNLFGYEKYY